MKQSPLTYWQSGGEVMCAGCRFVSPCDASALHGLYLDEARAATRAGCFETEATVLRLARELSEAAEAAGRWRRAGVYPAFG